MIARSALVFPWLAPQIPSSQIMPKVSKDFIADGCPATGTGRRSQPQHWPLTLTPPTAPRRRAVLSAVEIDGQPPPLGVSIELTGKLYVSPVAPDGSETPVLQVTSGKRIDKSNPAAPRVETTVQQSENESPTTDLKAEYEKSDEFAYKLPSEALQVLDLQGES